MTKRPRERTIQGTVTSFDAKLNSGFVRSDDADSDVYFHMDDVKANTKGIQVGAQLRGKCTSTSRGPKLVAIEVISLQSINPYLFYGGLAVFVSVFVAGMIMSRFEVQPVVAFLCGINAGSLFFMGLDKSLARSKAIRTPEALVYTMALLGGSPGVLLGIHVFKHKIRKVAFQFVLILIVAAQLLVLRVLGVELRPGL